MKNVRVNTAKVHILRNEDDDLFAQFHQGRSTYCGRHSPLQDFTPTTDQPTCQSCLRLAGRLVKHHSRLEAEVAEMRRQNALGRAELA